MSDSSPFGEEKPGFFDRLLRRAAQKQVGHVVRKSEKLRLTVPAAHAQAVQAALERWLAERGIGATVTSEDTGDGKAHLHATLGEGDLTKLDLASDAVQDELEKLLTDAVGGQP